VYVPLPDASTRQEILEMQLCKMPVASDVNIDELVSRTEGYSGAEVSLFITVHYEEWFILFI
jgi:SpoVK/Ycf46/Vps4 family AAA+-type ATPase